ncbi:MAG: class I SAM-dependent methyltransferase [Leptolinea sp.]|jgi:SAM-dependent methyltransferase|nr:class I SAM-dependent methyltransferase [Leptolinea sp.]
MNENSSKQVAEKWNEKFLNDFRFQDVPVRKLVKQFSELLPRTGIALEIAGGTGATTDFLQKHGLKVLEIDIAYQALRKAVTRNNGASYIVADARYFPLSLCAFDVICNFYFLERSVFSAIVELLKPGGIVLFETMTIDMLRIRPEISPSHLLAAGELKQAFPSWKIIHYYEGWTDSEHGHTKSIAQLVAQKPV